MTVRISVPAAGCGYPVCSETIVARASTVWMGDAAAILDDEERRFGLPKALEGASWAQRAVAAMDQRAEREAQETLARWRCAGRR